MSTSIRVTREDATWQTTHLYSGEVEQQSAPVRRVTYYIERGARERKVTYSSTSRRKIPLWAAEALRTAYGVIVPLNRIRVEKEAKP